MKVFCCPLNTLVLYVYLNIQKRSLKKCWERMSDSKKEPCKICMLISIIYYYPRLSPFEWDNPTPWIESDETENDCSLHNCFWHNWGSLMQQGSDICPRYMVPNNINETKQVCSWPRARLYIRLSKCMLTTISQLQAGFYSRLNFKFYIFCIYFINIGF